MSLPVITLLLLFIVGVIQDALAALYLRVVQDKKYVYAALLSIVITILSYGVWAAFIHQNLENNVSGITVYAIGGGLGTYLGLRRKNQLNSPPT